MPTIVAVEWREYERGLGNRPDGWSYHLTKEDAQKYIRDYWGTQPDGPAPDEYSAPGTPFPHTVDEIFYNTLKASGGNMRTYDRTILT